jgi:tRNA threonylcarbamoyladenosine biosynthesis protein TsaE
MHQLIIPSLDRIDEVASTFLQMTGEKKVMAFSGDLGAGKTTFIQAVCRQLGVNTDVNSPTFALINEYFTGSGEPIYHFDLFRIEDPVELFDVGYEEYFYSGRRCMIEWPEKAEDLIPEDALRVNILVLPDETRELRFSSGMP